MVQWINLNQNNTSVLAHRYSVLLKQLFGPILPPLVGLTAERQGGRLADEIWVDFKILNLLQVKLFGLLSCLISLQFYCSIRTAFSRLLSS